MEKFVKISVIRGLKTWFCYRTSKKKAFMTETYHKGFLLFYFQLVRKKCSLASIVAFFALMCQHVFAPDGVPPPRANEGVEERLNVSLSRNEGRTAFCSTVGKG